MAGFKKSVETFSISLTGTDLTASANLTKGQVLADCIWLASPRSNDGDQQAQIMPDVRLAAGPDRVIVERATAGGSALTVEISVIECDTSLVNVQQGTFSIASGTTTATVAITAVDLAKTFGRLFYKRGGSSDQWRRGTVRMSMNSTIELLFDRRQGSSVAIDGHWWTLEAKNDEFAVQAATWTIGTGVTSATAPLTSVTVGRTMVVSSYTTTTSSDDSHTAAVSAYLKDALTLEGIVNTAGQTQEITAFAVEFNATDGGAVQHAAVSQASGDAAAMTFPISPAIVIDDTTVHVVQQSGIATNSATASEAMSASSHAAKLNSTIEGQAKRDRNNGATTAGQVRCEVVSWPPASAPPVVGPFGPLVNRGGRLQSLTGGALAA